MRLGACPVPQLLSDDRQSDRMIRKAINKVLKISGLGELPPEWFAGWARTLRREAREWEEAKAATRNGPKVLIATSVGEFSPGLVLEGLLAVALTLRGANVHLLLCDRLLPACQACVFTLFGSGGEFAEQGPSQRLCGNCFASGSQVYGALGLPIHLYSELVNREDIDRAASISSEIAWDEIRSYTKDGLSIGEHAMAGALRFFSRGTVDGEPYGEAVVPRYFQASLLTISAMRRLFDQVKFEAAAFHHGIYVPQGLIGEAARRCGIRVSNWQAAYRKRRFIFSHGETYHHALLSEPVDKWENMAWSNSLESDLMQYLESRWQGTRDWIWFHEKPEENVDRIVEELGLDRSKPWIGLLTNVIWDAQLHYKTNAFNSMIEWLVETLRYFQERPDLQLVIRVHPAEIRGAIPSRQPVTEEIRKAFPDLAPNIFVIPPESQVSTYALMEECNTVIIYGTKTGVELTSMGIPVIVAGEAWIRNKGLTLDAVSPEQYFGLLDRLPLAGSLSPAQTRRARMYAYHFFFRRMIPVEPIEPAKGWPPFRPNVNSLRELAPAVNPGLDTICNGILRGTDFIYPAELHPDDSD